MYFHYLL